MSAIGGSTPQVQRAHDARVDSQAPATTTPATKATEGGLANITGKSASRTGGGLGYKHTTWGNGFSIGKCLASIIRLPGRGLRELGNLIQGGQKEGARYWAGAAFKGLGNIIGTAAGLVGGTVTFGESVVSNLAGFALRLAGAAVLGTLGMLGLVGTAITGGKWQAPIEGLKLAKDLVLDTPMFDRFRGQEKLTPEVAKKHLWDAEFAEGSHPSSCREFKPKDLPKEVLKNWNVNEEQMKFGGAFALKGAGALGTYTNVSLAWDTTDAKPGEKGTLVVRFGGTNNARHALTDLQQALGVPDGAYREARDLVAQLSKAFPGQVRVVGHSMGGGLAQYAGISAGVPVTSFNGVGLHPHLRDKLGADKIDKSDVTHINTSGDQLAKFSAIDMSSQQIGRRIEIEGGGHGMKHIQEQMRLMAR